MKTSLARFIRPLALLVLSLAPAGCDRPETYVVLDNHYPPATPDPLVVYRAFWQAVSFQTPVFPGASSDKMATVSASANPAYAILAPGWDPKIGTPTSFVVLQSKSGFAVHLDQTLKMDVDDSTFAGNCAAGSPLSQDQADFITGRVFAADFATLRYDAATCTSTADR